MTHCIQVSMDDESLGLHSIDDVGHHEPHVEKATPSKERFWPFRES